MTEVSVRELKGNLARYLKRAKDGEQIVVTSRGKPVASLSAPPRANMTTEEKLDEMERLGMVRRGTGGKIKLPKTLIKLHGEGPSVSEMVLEDRGEPIP